MQPEVEDAVDIFLLSCSHVVQFLVRDVIYTSRAYATMSMSICV